MFRKITRKYIRNFLHYFKLVLKQLPILMENPFYFLKEYLEISKSIISKVLVEFPDINLDRINRKIHGVNFPFYFKFAPRYRSMYLGLNSTSVIRVLLKHIKKKSVFIDAGANIGYMSAVGAALVGKHGGVHCFEPVPIYLEKLEEMANKNKEYEIIVNKFALGESLKKSTININKVLIGANSMVSGLVDSDLVKDTIEVDVKRLDDYILEKDIKNISLIKIDVEGYELPLLKGLTRFFEKNINSLPPLIVEITPEAYALLESKLEDLENLLAKFDYQAYNSDEKHRIDIKKLEQLTDVLFKQTK